MIEAALFMSGRELSVPELKKLTGIASAGHIREMIGELGEEYAKRGSAVEIFEMDGAYLMKIKDDYVPHVRQFAQDVTVSRPALRTLSYIARHNGILKSQVVKRIGPAVYDDVRELVKNGFILQRKYGRSSKLFLTDKFRAYFEQGKPQPKSVQGEKEGEGASSAPEPAKEGLAEELEQKEKEFAGEDEEEFSD